MKGRVVAQAEQGDKNVAGRHEDQGQHGAEDAEGNLPRRERVVERVPLAPEVGHDGHGEDQGALESVAQDAAEGQRQEDEQRLRLDQDAGHVSAQVGCRLSVHLRGARAVTSAASRTASSQPKRGAPGRDGAACGPEVGGGRVVRPARWARRRRVAQRRRVSTAPTETSSELANFGVRQFFDEGEGHGGPQGRGERLEGAGELGPRFVWAAASGRRADRRPNRRGGNGGAVSKMIDRRARRDAAGPRQEGTGGSKRARAR